MIRFLLVIIGILLVALLITNFLPEDSKLNKKRLNQIFYILISLSVGIGVVGYLLYRETPNYWELAKKSNPDFVLLDKNDRHLTKVKVTNFDITGEAINDFSNALAKNTFIKSLWLLKINNDTANVISESLKINKSVVDLKLEDMSMDALAIFAENLNLYSNLNSLDLSNNKLDIDFIFKLQKGLKNNKRIKSLNLSEARINETISAQLANILSDKYGIEELSLKNNDINDYGIDQIVDKINNSNLKVLNLWGNRIQDEGAIRIADALVNNRTLLEVDLSYNLISDQGLIELAHALTRNRTLKRLYLKRNNFSDESVDSLIMALDKNNTIEFINIDSHKVSKEKLELLQKKLTRR